MLLNLLKSALKFRHLAHVQCFHLRGKNSVKWLKANTQKHTKFGLSVCVRTESRPRRLFSLRPIHLWGRMNPACIPNR